MWKNLLLIPLSIVITLLVVEGGARIWFTPASPYPVPPGLLVQEARGFWVQEPNLRGVMDNGVDYRSKPLSMDSNGNREVACRPDSQTDLRRLVLVGDSQTFGFGLGDEEAWPSILSCALRKDGFRIDVENFGVPGLNIGEYHARIARDVVGIVGQGDIVVITVTWNDMHTEPDATYVRTLLPQNSPDTLDATPRKPIANTFRQPYSRAFPETWRYKVYRATGLFVPVFTSIGEFIDTFGHVSVVWREFMARARLVYYSFRPAETLQQKIGPATFDGNFRILADMQRRLARRGARMIVHLLPNRLFSDRYYFDAYSAGGNNLPARDYMSFIAKPLCEKYSLTCMTSFDVLKTDVRDAFSFPVDGHLNEAGAARVAENLRGYLESRPCSEGGLACRP